MKNAPTLYDTLFQMLGQHEHWAEASSYSNLDDSRSYQNQVRKLARMGYICS